MSRSCTTSSGPSGASGVSPSWASRPASILCIPHFIVLWLLAILIYILLLFAWLPVLINGRQADLIYNIVGGYLRWAIRVYAYVLLLSGPYPPFRLS